jgi:subtilisin family serine protease
MPERNRREHADRLSRELVDAAQTPKVAEGPVEGHSLEFRGEPGYEFAFESLEFRPSGIILDSVHQEGDVLVATVFVPAGKLAHFVRRLEAYASQDTQKGQPRHEALVAAIKQIRPAAVRSFWTDDPLLYPTDEQTHLWWEVWLRRGADEAPDALVQRFTERVERCGLIVNPRRQAFPERVVVLVWSSVERWTRSLAVLNMLAELRRARELNAPFLDLGPHEQGEFIKDACQRLTHPSGDAPAVCLLDTGVAQAHPLLQPVLAEADVFAVEPGWGGHDHDGHGTHMAGIGVYGSELAELLAGNRTVALRHRLESVKLLPPMGHNRPELYGALTQEGVARAEFRHPQRKRVTCLAITASDRDHGRPSAWSASLDEHSSGALDAQRRLYVVAGGNLDVVSDAGYAYPASNMASGVQDPAQAWNALTVGACTERVAIGEEGFTPLAPLGGLCPSSRTSCCWEDQSWPYKPDLCAEGGNYAVDAAGRRDCLDELQLLTTAMTSDGRLLGLMRDTSAATAQVARLAAILQARYPELRPETIRALLVHSARWTPAMEAAAPGARKDAVQRRLRCFGYGVPNLGRAIASRDNQVSLIYEGALQPFRQDGSDIKTAEYHLHPLPWPRSVLHALGAVDVTVRVTLSYFIEPSPGNRGWGAKHRYQSHGLRFEMRRPGETESAFRQRVSKLDPSEAVSGAGTAGSSVAWVVGPKSRDRGSLHCDWWTDSAAAVADCGQLAVYPVRGWWSDRPHLGRYDRPARYSLVVSLETASVTTDLYTPIESLLQVPIRTMS